MTQALYDRMQELAEALHEIQQWSQAYPVEVFPEPDWKKARELLAAGGISIDQVSGSLLRRALVNVGKIASEALKMPDEKEAPGLLVAR